MNFETIRISQETGVLFAEIAAPPMNLLGPELVRDLVSLIQQAEADHTLRVFVFKSADPDYFISHVDVTRIKEHREQAAKLTGEASIALLFRHLSASRLVTRLSLQPVLWRQLGHGERRVPLVLFARPRYGRVCRRRQGLPELGTVEFPQCRKRRRFQPALQREGRKTGIQYGYSL